MKTLKGIMGFEEFIFLIFPLNNNINYIKFQLMDIEISMSIKTIIRRGVIAMRKIFVIRNNEGKYVDKTCLYLDKITQTIVYDFYDDYRNSVILYFEEDADMSITYLTEKAKELGLDCSFTKEYVCPDYSDS